VMLLEDDYKTTYEGFDPSSVDSYIMFELMQDQYFDQSLSFATLVQQEFTSVGRSDRGVRQAGFWVLHKSACPSVLVEMGFISNANEEKYLASEKGKSDITNSIFNAFVTYKTAYDRKHGIVSAAAAQKDAAKAEEKKPAVAPKDTKAEKLTSKEVKQQAEKKAEPKADKTEPAAPAAATPEAAPAEQPAAEKPATEVPVYRVQIFSTTKKVPAGDATFKGLKNCKYTQDGKFYKYTYGEDTDYRTIVDIQQELRAKFKDCFVVAFYKGKQIPVKEARSMK